MYKVILILTYNMTIFNSEYIKSYTKYYDKFYNLSIKIIAKCCTINQNFTNKKRPA